MKKLFRGVIVFALGISLFSTTGCIDASTTVFVNKDGSGRVVETIYLTKQFEQMMQQMALHSGDQSAGGAIEINEAEAEKKASKMGKGVRLVSVKEIQNKDGSKGTLTTYEFDNIETLRISPDPNIPGEERMKQTMPQAETKTKDSDPIVFTFNPGNKAELAIKMPREKPSVPAEIPEPTQRQQQPGPQEMAMMKQMFAGFRVRMLVAINGNITDTNAAHVDKTSKPNHITLFDMNIGELLNDEQAFKKLSAIGKTQNIQEAMGKFQNIKGIKAEPSEKITITFK